MAKWLRRRGHHVTVLTTSAYGALDDDAVADVERTADAQSWRARLRGKETVGAMFDSPTYAGRPHPLSRVLVPEPLVAAWAPFARSRRAAPAARAPLRLRDHELAARSRRIWSAMALHRRGVPWVADIRDAWTFESLRPEFPTAAQRALDGGSSAAGSAAADAVVCVSEPAAADLRERGIAAPAARPERLGPRGGGGRRRADRPARPRAHLARLHGALRQLRTRPAAARRGAPAARRLRPGRGGKARARRSPGRSPRTRRELFAADVAPARIVLAGSLERERALALQREADALLLVAQPQRSQLLNIKLFEYLASGTPILALAAGTEAGRVAGDLGAEVAPADDPEAIVVALARVAAGQLTAPAAGAVDAYTYPAPAAQMEDAVEAAIAAHRRE